MHDVTDQHGGGPGCGDEEYDCRVETELLLGKELFGTVLIASRRGGGDGVNTHEECPVFCGPVSGYPR